LAARKAIGLVAAIGAAAVFATSAAAAGSASLLTLRGGDNVRIAGTPIHCAVSTQTPATMLCGIGTTAPQSGSYFVAASDAAVLMVKVGSAHAPSVVVRKLPEPALRGALFKLAAPRRARAFVVRSGDAIAVATTRTFCVVTAVAGANGIACGLYQAGSSHYASGTYAALVSTKLAGLVQTSKNGAETTIVRKKQP
jgi:hypothetical protein